MKITNNGRYIVPRFIETNINGGSREYDPYTRLYEERIIFIVTSIDQIASNDILAQLLCLEYMNPNEDIKLYINSNNGTIDGLMTLYDTMQYISCDIQTICIGECSSVAALILASGTTGKRFILPNARVMLRQPYVNLGWGQVSDLEIHANEVLRIRKFIEFILNKHTKRDSKKISEDIERDKIILAEDAVKYGLVDSIINKRSND